MAIDLTKKVYKKLEDGAYNLKVHNWDIKQAANGEDYISLKCTLTDIDRPVQINLFEKGLDITAANVSTHFNLEELTLVEILDVMIGKELPAYHHTVVQGDKTYYNWYICNTPNNNSDVEAF